MGCGASVPVHNSDMSTQQHGTDTTGPRSSQSLSTGPLLAVDGASSFAMANHFRAVSQVADSYTILNTLGEGASCRVVSVQSRATGEKYAMKIMDKSEKGNAKLYENETAVLSDLSHPNVVGWHDSYEDQRSYHIVTSFLAGGELFDRVSQGSFSERAAAELSKQMIKAIAYCHSRNIIHRDLKPENFVFDSPDVDSAMRLIDFGCAKKVEDDTVVQDVAGSPYYCAPEILSDTMVRTGAIWKAADMWSVGVIIFLLVCGYPPFNGDSQDKIFNKIRRGAFRFPTPDELGGIQLSESVRSLIRALLVMNPSRRLSAETALEHPWIEGQTAPDTPLPPMVVNALSAFRSQCRLKKAAARVMRNRMTDEDLKHLETVFKTYDVNGDGQLGPEEVARMIAHISANEPTVMGLSSANIARSQSEVKTIMSALDEDGDGGVSIDEFATAAAMGKLSNEEEIKRSFDAFDLDSDGFITHIELERVCRDFLSPQAAKDLVNEVDQDHDGKITFKEWLIAMNGQSRLSVSSGGVGGDISKQRDTSKREPVRTGDVISVVGPTVRQRRSSQRVHVERAVD